MDKEEREKTIDLLDNLRGMIEDSQGNDYDFALKKGIEALKRESCEDIMAIHTQGLDEEIRCTMCTNPMRSDRGCDGGCMVDEDVYEKVMDIIRNREVKE